MRPELPEWESAAAAKTGVPASASHDPWAGQLDDPERNSGRFRPAPPEFALWPEIA